MPSLELLLNHPDHCGEGPLWDPAHQRFYWNDMNASLVFEYDWHTGMKKTLQRDLMVAGMAFRRGGGFVFAGFTGLHVWRGPDDYTTLITEHAGETLFFNDILADPAGRVLAGTFYWGADNRIEKPGKLYRIDPDQSIRVVDEGFGVANGLALSPDNRTLYFADSTARRIYAYAYDPATGAPTNRRIFVQAADSEGLPDGLTVDAEGFVWCAYCYTGEAVRYDPDGQAERRIQLPVQQLASLNFGGPDLNELYITTAADEWVSDFTPPGYTADQSRLGGPLYRIKMDVQGKLEHSANL